MKLAERCTQLPDSDFVRIMRMAVENPGIISLGPGEPDFSAPAFIRTATKKALDAEKTHYSSMAGRAELREAIAKKWRKEKRGRIDPDKNVVVTCGSTEAIFMALTCVLDPGEQVVVPDPTFLIYEPIPALLNGYPVSVPLDHSTGFQLTSEEVRRAIKDPKQTRAMILCTPGNPTGTVLSKKCLEEMADVAVEHDLLVLVDEAYEKFVYGTKFAAMGKLNGMEDYVLTLHSFSKTYAMPGYRVGYAVGPEKIVSAMTKLHVLTSLCAPTMSQIAATAALNGPQGCVERMRKSYDKRRRLVYNRLKNISGFDLVEPRGAFYAFPRISFKKANGKPFSSIEFVEWLIKNAGVLTVPGPEFGRCGEGFVRISYATDYNKIREAFDCIEEATRKLKT